MVSHPPRFFARKVLAFFAICSIFLHSTATIVWYSMLVDKTNALRKRREREAPAQDGRFSLCRRYRRPCGHIGPLFAPSRGRIPSASARD